jgi:hypothetical protein
MFPEKSLNNEKECPVCYAAHDEEIHDATLRIRGWFHHQVTHMLEEEEFFAAPNRKFAEAQVA